MKTTKLEKLSDEILNKISEECKKNISDEQLFLDNYKKKSKTDVVFKSKNKLELYYIKFKKILDIYNNLLCLNKIFADRGLPVEKKETVTNNLLDYDYQKGEIIFSFGLSIKNCHPLIDDKSYGDFISSIPTVHNPIKDYDSDDNFAPDALKFYHQLTKIKNEKFDNELPHISKLAPIGTKAFYEEECLGLIEENTKKVRKIELILRARKKGREKMENVGYVYVLYNDAYPNTYKIGSTYGLPEERAEELTGTGHLTPFKVVAKYKTQSAEYYEKITHKLLKKSRVKKNREFFKLELNKIRDCLKQVTSISENGEKKIKFNTLKNRINF